MKILTTVLLILFLLFMGGLAFSQVPIWTKIELTPGDSTKTKLAIIDWRDVGSVMFIQPNKVKVIQLPAGRSFFPNAIYLDGFDRTKGHKVEVRVIPDGVTEVPSVLGSIDNVDSRTVYFGTWLPFNNAVFHNWTSSYSSVTDATITITFTGKQIEWWTEKARNHGIAGLSVDGSPEVTVDIYANTTVNNTQKVWTSQVLTSGQHSLRIRVTGTRNAGATENTLIHDRILVVQ